jgi:hypothetical protein
MSAKSCIPSALLLTLLAVSPAPCADPPAPGNLIDLYTQSPANGIDADPNAATNSRLSTSLEDASLEPAPRAPNQPSSWITYQRPGCCGPCGGNGPITYELYIRTGPSLPVGPGGLSRTIATGWQLQGGGRSLFFNVPRTSAWTVDVGLGNIWNDGNRPNLSFSIPQSPALVHTLAMYRTYVALTGGKMWYLRGPANNSAYNWRVGWDGGGQLGTERLDLFDPGAPNGSNFRRRNDIYGGLLTGFYTDIEIPCKSCAIYTGLRAEYLYTWCDITPINSDISNVNLLMTIGFRF